MNNEGKRKPAAKRGYIDPLSPVAAKAARDFAIAKSKGNWKQMNDIRRQMERLRRKSLDE